MNLLLNLPLPLVLSTVVFAQNAAVELEPVIASEPYPPPGLNLDTPSETGSLLGIPVQETPASVEVVERPLIESISRAIHRYFRFAVSPITKSRNSMA